MSLCILKTVNNFRRIILRGKLVEGLEDFIGRLEGFWSFVGGDNDYFLKLICKGKEGLGVRYIWKNVNVIL